MPRVSSEHAARALRKTVCRAARSMYPGADRAPARAMIRPRDADCDAGLTGRQSPVARAADAPPTPRRRGKRKQAGKRNGAAAAARLPCPHLLRLATPCDEHHRRLRSHVMGAAALPLAERAATRAHGCAIRRTTFRLDVRSLSLNAARRQGSCACTWPAPCLRSCSTVARAPAPRAGWL